MFFLKKKISYFRPDKSLAKGKQQLLNRSSCSVIQGQRKHQSMSFGGLYNEGGNLKSFKKLALWLAVVCQLSAGINLTFKLLGFLILPTDGRTIHPRCQLLLRGAGSDCQCCSKSWEQGSLGRGWFGHGSPPSPWLRGVSGHHSPPPDSPGNAFGWQCGL